MPRLRPETIYKRQVERARLALNPKPGRSEADRVRVTRYITRIARELDYWLKQSLDNKGEPRPTPWLRPLNLHGSDREESHYLLLKNTYQTSGRDKNNHLTVMRNHQLKATNNVVVVVTFINPMDEPYTLAQTLISPLMAPDGYPEPLTYAQWSILIEPFVLSRVYWSWLQGVRNLFGDNSYNFATFNGWHMEPNKRLLKVKPEWPPTTGSILIDRFSRSYCNLCRPDDEAAS